ncbi:hypothetical protein D9M70_609680 [compost metagenome]
MKPSNDDVDSSRLRRLIDDPRLKVVAYAVTAEHHVIKVDEVAPLCSAVIQVKPAFVFEALREELQHRLLALPVLLDVQEVSG